MKILSGEYGFWFYAGLTTLSIIAPLPFIWVGYMCITGGEYWPPIFFGGIIFIMWFAAFAFFCKARAIKRSQKCPEDDNRNESSQ